MSGNQYLYAKHTTHKFKIFGVFLSTLIIAITTAGLYGILNDQITYSISTEYFTKFKYLQFGVEPAVFGGNRQAVAVIGFLATWWVGLIIALVFGLTGLVYNHHKTMYRMVTKALTLSFCITLCMAVVGFLYGRFILIKTGVNWWLPHNLQDKNSFIIVGSIHNFSYLGGLLGLFAGLIYLFVNKKYPLQSGVLQSKSIGN